MKYEVVCSTIDLPREEWLALRRQGIGGSDAAAIAGLNPYKTALDVYNEKVLGISQDFNASAEQRLWIGHEIEPIMRKRFFLDKGIEVQRRNSVFRSTNWPVAMANIDGWCIGQDAIWECKTTSLRNAWQWEEGVPEWYVAQVHHYFYVMGVDRAWVTVLIGGQEIRHYEIKRDSLLVDLILDSERGFWKMVQDNVPPKQGENESSEKYREAIKNTFREAVPGSALVLTEEYQSIVDSYNSACLELKKAEEKKDKLAAQIQLAMGTNETAITCAGNRITWKSYPGRVTVDGKALKADMPELYMKYAKEGDSYRRFVVK